MMLAMHANSFLSKVAKALHLVCECSYLREKNLVAVMRTGLSTEMLLKH
jgi:hypothetical protein